METPATITVIIEGWSWSIGVRELTINTTIVSISVFATLLVTLGTWLADRRSWNRRGRRKGP